MPPDASDEMLGIVQMSGELTLDNLKRSATLLEIVRVATERNREMQQYGLVYVEQDIYLPPRKFVCISDQRQQAAIHSESFQ